MAPKEHGTSAIPVQTKLRWDVDRKIADRICNYNRTFSLCRISLLSAWMAGLTSLMYHRTLLRVCWILGADELCERCHITWFIH